MNKKSYKIKCFFLLLLGCFAAVCPLLAQTIIEKVNQEFRLTSISNFELLQCRQFENKIYGVGWASKTGQKQKEGLILVFEISENYKINLTKTQLIPGEGSGLEDDIFQDITQCSDNTFLLVGQSKKKAWLVQLDETLEKTLVNEIQEDKEEAIFKKVLWSDIDNCGLIVGENSLKKGKLWIGKFEKTTKNSTYFNTLKYYDNVKELLFLEKDWYSDNFNIGFQAEKTKNTYKVEEIDIKGNRKQDKTTWNLPSSSYFVADASASALGEFLLTGSYAVTDADIAWGIGDGRLGSLPIIHSFGNPKRNEKGFKVTAHLQLNQYYWLLFSDESARRSTVPVFKLALMHKEQKELIEKNRIEVKTKSNTPNGVACLLPYKDSTNSLLFVVLNETSKTTNTQQLRCVLYTADNIPIFTSKGMANNGPKLKFEPTSLHLNNGSPNNHIHNGEKSSIVFTVKNTGDEIFRGGAKIEIQLNILNGLTISKTNIALNDPIPINGQKTYSIAINAASNIAAGTSKIICKLMRAGQIDDTQTIEIESGGQEMLTTTIVAEDRGKKEITVRDKNYVFKGQVVSSNRNKAKELVPILNGVPIPKDDKGTTLLSDEEVSQGKSFVTNFTVKLGEYLKEGNNNIFYLHTNDASSDTFKFVLSNRKRLIVRTFGVPEPKGKEYPLKYTVKDANEVAQAFERQKDNGFFESTDIQTFSTNESTTSQSFRDVFGELKDQFDKKEIDSLDYIVVFISAHAKLLSDGHLGVIPSDYDNKESRIVDYNELLAKYLEPMKCMRFIFIDACHSGGGKATEDTALGEALYKANNTVPAIIKFLSCKENELSWEYEKGENGYFADALIDALEAKKVTVYKENSKKETEEITADYKNFNGFVSVAELDAFITRRVAYLIATTHPSQPQTPKSVFNTKPDKNGQKQEELTLFKLKK
ncbi:MAG: hypothetical protein RLZZ292_2169 [Bacteroidota bacterium]|jgi:hypothetical protein